MRAMQRRVQLNRTPGTPKFSVHMFRNKLVIQETDAHLIEAELRTSLVQPRPVRIRRIGSPGPAAGWQRT